MLSGLASLPSALVNALSPLLAALRSSMSHRSSSCGKADVVSPQTSQTRPSPHCRLTFAFSIFSCIRFIESSCVLGMER